MQAHARGAGCILERSRAESENGDGTAHAMRPTMQLTALHWPPRTILVAVDAGPTAETLIDRATTLALLLGARLVVVHAVCVTMHDVPNEATGLLEVLEGLDVNAHTRVKHWVRRAALTGVSVSSVVLHGEPLRVLADTIRSEHADLVVVGSRHRGGLARTFVPGFHEELTALGSCGVLALPVDGVGRSEGAEDRTVR